MLRSLLLAILPMLFLFCCTNAQQKGILGKWYFDRFGGPHGEIAERSDSDMLRANKQDIGTTFTFAADNKLTVSPPGGSKNDSRSQDYQLFPDRKLVVIGSDSFRIMLLTSDILELYLVNETKPALFLKRTRDGKTAMSAPN